MKGEIRGLLSGTYQIDEAACFTVNKTDNGTTMSLVDLEADMVYTFVIDEKGKVIASRISLISDVLSQEE